MCLIYFVSYCQLTKFVQLILVIFLDLLISQIVSFFPNHLLIIPILKLRYKASKKYKKNFFKTSNEDVFFYRMTHVDRSAWTFDKNIFKNYKDGLKKSEKYLNKLTNLLRNNNIEIDFVLYPHPSQIVYKDLFHRPYWENWAKINNINLISLYEDFDGEDKREITLKTFIFGDLHWNKKGTKIVFNSLIKKIDF